MIAYHLLRIAAQAIAAVFGGIGVFAVYISFHQPDAGATAILLLGMATVMQRVLELRK